MIIADLHLHSKYSRAVSRDMTLPTMASFAQKKGLNLLTTGDWTHPLWLREIQSSLKEIEDGVFGLKQSATSNQQSVRFILSVEVSSIYFQGGKTRRIHSLIFSPSFETCEKINRELIKKGANLASDGRPILGISAKNLLEMVLSIDREAFMIPAHIWTPWFSLYGSMSGFDSIEECFEEISDEIFAIETGLSSDPSMNWRIRELDKRSIVSFSDAHSPMKMGREATVFVPKDGMSNVKFQMSNVSYNDIRLALKKDPKGKLKVGFTIEFYPEEGKYHYTGHRNCRVIQSPQETKEKGMICPVCSRPLTIGVMHRVENLSSRDEKIAEKLNEKKLRWILDPLRNHAPFVKLVPLNEIIAEAIGASVLSTKVKALYEEMTESLGEETDILLRVDIDEIRNKAGDNIANAILKVRKGEIYIRPGYDGEYGVVKIETEEPGTSSQEEKKAIPQTQLGIDF